MRLDQLKQNDKAIITGFINISEINLRRINSMGINIGSNIHIDPDLLELGFNKCFVCDGIEFCLRKKDAHNIIVEKVY